MNALDWLDRAFTMTRRAGGRFTRQAWLASVPLAFLFVFIFYVERIEGVRSLRALLALGLGLAWWWRAHQLGSASRAVLVELSVELPAPPSAFHTLGLASIAGLVLALALLPAAALARAGAPGLLFGVWFALPVTALAPSWIARAGVDEQGGAPAFVTAARDGASLRGSALLVHAFLLTGMLLLFLNLLAVAGMLLGAVQGLLGVEVAALESFMSLENDFAMLVVGVVVLWVAEPLRVAIASVALAHAQSQRDGADLRRMVSDLSTGGADDRSARGRDAGRAAIVLLVLSAVALPARAQAPEEPPYSQVEPAPAPPVALEPGDAPPYDPSQDQAAEVYYGPELPALAPQDQATEDAVASILTGSEFREFDDAVGDSGERGDGPSWLKRLLEAIERWLSEQDEPSASGEIASPMPLPPAWVFVALAVALLVAVAAFLVISRRKEEQLPSATDVLGASLDPRDRAPEQHLDEAAELAARGLHREAFRSLYLATLVALDRRGEIDFDPARTNWHYLRQMGVSARALVFRTFTQLFDRKWYGDEHTTREEYERGRELATSLAAPRNDAAADALPREGVVS